MDEPLELPPRTGDVRTVDRDLLLVPLDLGLAHWTVGRRADLFGRIVRIAALGNRPDHLRNDFTGALYLYPVSRSQIFVSYQIEVVECRELYGRAADLHGFEHCERIERARTADVYLDREEPRFRDVGGELAGDCITRLARDDAELLPERELIHLHDAAVDREVEGPAHPRLERACPFMRLVERHTALSVRSDGNSPRGQLVEQLGLPVESEPHALRDGDRITEKAERARRRNRRIEYAQGARRRVARIRIHRLARLYALGVHSLEAAEGHVHLAANLHQRWMATAFEPQGNLANRS